MKRTLSLVLSLIMILGIFASMPVTVNAASVDDLIFSLNEDGASYSITDCNESVSGELVISETYNGLPVTDIGGSAFKNCTSLTSITVPDSVIRIESSSFMDCTSLASITIPDSVYIEFSAFENTAYYNNTSNWVEGVLYICNHLIEAETTISGDYNIKNGTVSISDSAFENCTSLVSVTIPDSVTNIGNSAFYGCTSLASVTIPDGVKRIGDSAFNGCTSLASVTIPNSAKSIGVAAFKKCEKLTSIIIPNGVTEIKGDFLNGCFAYCTNLATVTIPVSVTDIGSHAFWGCANLKYVFYTGTEVDWDKITIGNSAVFDNAFIHYNSTVHTYGEYIYDYSTNTKTCECNACGYVLTEEIVLEDLLTFALNEDGRSYSITDCKESVFGEIIIPETYNSLPVTNIGSYAFSNCKNITSIIIPNTISSINDYAFYNCKNLKDYKIEDLAAWCSTDFGECIINYFPWNLYLNDILVTELVIPKSVTEIKDYAFDGCGSIISVTVPEGVIRIGAGAFSNNHSLMEVNLPEGIIDIGMCAFSATGIGNNTQIRENGALYIDKYLIEVFAPSSENYVIKDGTVLIAGGAFTWTFTEDIQIKTIEIPSSVKYICENAFSHCTSLREMTIPCGVQTIGNNVFYCCTNLYSITIPDSVTSIGDSAFSECKNLTSLNIPEGVSSIGVQTFYNCDNLQSVTIPDSVTTIGDYAFYCCPNFKYLFYSGSKESWNSVIKGSMNYILNDVYIHYNSTGHEPSDWITDINPTCVDYGAKHIECLQCGLCMEEEIIPATGIHKQSDWIIDAFVTCTENGSKHVECMVCGETLNTIETPATGHTEVIDKAIEATCTTAGKTEGRHCSVCNAVIKAQTAVPVKEHTPSDWIIDKELTCTTNGSKHKECTECREVIETETILATGHNSSDWIIDSQATINAPGKKHKECTECGEVLETATIPQPKPATPKATTTNEIGGVQVTWNAVDGATKYVVYRRQGGSNSWVNVGTTTGNTLLDKNVKSGIYYVYSVRAYNVSGGYSDFVSANTNTRKYMAVPHLTGISNATNGLYIKWNPVSGVTNGYRVYRRGAGSVHWYYLGTVKTTYFTDTTIKNNSGEYYRYTVIADGGYHSKFDTTGLYLKRLANPTLVSAVSSKSGITVKWGSVKTATDYYVYRKTANSGWVRIATLSGNSTTIYLDKTAKKGTTYTYTVRACSGPYISYFNSGISCKDKY